MTLKDTLDRYDAHDRPPADKLAILALADLGEATRRDLVEATGLGTGTVYNAVSRLEDDGTVAFGWLADGGHGQPAETIALTDPESEPESGSVWKSATS